MRAAAVLLAGGAAANPNRFESTSPGGATGCSHGTPWAFMHRKGTTDDLVIEFEGGGACWDKASCKAGGPYKASISVNQELRTLNSGKGGIHGTNAANPVKEWNHLYLPYCTGDCHAGAADKDYGGGVTVQHRGHANMQAALKWAKANFPAKPGRVLVTGCSAGSCASIFNWPFIADAYPDAKISVFGDSCVLATTEYMYNSMSANWPLTLDTRIAGLRPERVGKWSANVTCQLHKAPSDAFPSAATAWYSSNADAVQSNYYAMGGGDAKDFTAAARGLMKCFTQETANEHTFIASGDAHCRSQDDGFFGVEADGVNLGEWVTGLVGGKQIARAVDCAADGEKGCAATDPAAAQAFGADGELHPAR